MKNVVRILALQLICIIFFTFFYFHFSDHFDNTQTKMRHYKKETLFEPFVDFFLFSTTIQTGVGISNILPISLYAELFMIVQQLIMISINVLALYVFSN
jgi:hypothetical protein